MDIIDILMARAMTPQGQIESYAARAEQAVNAAMEAVNNIASITEQTNANNIAAQEALENVESALNELDTVGNLQDIADNEISKLAFAVNIVNSNNAITNNLKITYPDDEQTNVAVTKYYTTTGNNIDGTMTQKAITQAMRSATVNLGAANAGKFVAVGTNGELVPSNSTPVNPDTPIIPEPTDEPLGLEIDYVNMTYTRLGQAANLSAGADFDQFTMYGGRKRCTVADDGTIIAFYGDDNFVEDGSNGQVMVYQPKFYYYRKPVSFKVVNGMKIIEKEEIYISETPRTNFKLHPAFINDDNESLDYILYSAYEGCSYDPTTDYYNINDGAVNFTTDQLSSIVGARTISGIGKLLNVTNAELLASNRGTNWHISALRALSATQILMLIEFGTLNMQMALEKGYVMINQFNNNYSCLTGSTSLLGNQTGAAQKSINGLTKENSSVPGQRAISYRGQENPWGNIRKLLCDVSIEKSGYATINNKYSKEFTDILATAPKLPSNSNYISGFSYINNSYDWLFIPGECQNGNSAIPVGDTLLIASPLTDTMALSYGGGWSSGDESGIFHYGATLKLGAAAPGVGARLIYIPTINNIYNSNIEKWATTQN